MAMGVIDRMNIEEVRGTGGTPRHITLIDTSLTCQLKSTDTSVIIDTTNVTGDGNAIATLPPMAEFAGKFLGISAPEGATGGDLSVYIKETGAELGSGGDMDADDEFTLLYCTGIVWQVVLTTVS